MRPVPSTRGPPVAEPLTALTGQLAGVTVAVLQQFGVPMLLRRKLIIPSDRGEPTVRFRTFPCRGVSGMTTRKYDKATNIARRVLEVTITDPGVEPQAEDEILTGDGKVIAVITSDDGIQAVRPDLVTTVCYLLSLRRA